MTKIFACVLLLLAARCAWAIDGQVLINQSTVINSGGFPYRITQPGSYKLSGNLVAPVNQSAILIAASNVVLDLNGFNVQCSVNDAVSVAIVPIGCITDERAATHTVAVRRGTITYTGVLSQGILKAVIGVYLNASERDTIEDLHFEAEHSNNFSYFAGPYSILRHNVGKNQFINCPSLVEGNVNTTNSQGSNGEGCVYVNNVGPF